MLKLRTLLLFVILSSASFGQNTPYIDSLYNVIETCNDSTKVEMRFKIASHYKKLHNYVSAIKEYKLIIKESEVTNDLEGIQFGYSALGTVYRKLGDASNSLKCYNKSFNLALQLKDSVGMARCFKDIGYLYFAQKEYDAAISNFRKGLKISLKNKDVMAIGKAYNNIAVVYTSQKKYDPALNFHFRALQLRLTQDYLPAVAGSYNNIGKVYEAQGITDKAYDYYKRGFDLKLEIGDTAHLSVSYRTMAKVKFQQKDYNTAVNYIEESIDYAKLTQDATALMNSSRTAYQIYNKLNKTKKALKMLELSVTMKDSIRNEANQKDAIKSQYQYSYQQQSLTDSISYAKKQEFEVLKHQTQLENEKLRQYTLFIGLAIAIVFALIMFSRFRVTRKQKVLIELQKQEVEEAHKEITDSINYAERIQRSFLATNELLDKNLQEYFVFFQPKEAVSGDFYWASKLDNGNFAMVNADSTGHGVPGAIMSILNISSIENAIEMGYSKPSDIFNETRRRIINRLKKDGSKDGGKDGMDASIICFDFKNNTLSYTAANNPIWIIRNNEIIKIKPDKMPVGKHDNDQTPFTENEISIQKDDQVYTLTDGYQDQFGGKKGKKFMIKRMREYVLSISHLPMKDQHTKIKETFNNWKEGHEQVDDVCVIGVKI